MKLLKKLLPIATIASTVAVVTPMVTACSSITMVDITKEFKPSITQYTPKDDEKDGVNAEKALEIYLNAASSNTEIIRQDALVDTCGQEEIPEGISASIGIKINKVDATKKTVDFEIETKESGKFSYESVSTEADATIWVKVTNAKIETQPSTNWAISIGSYDVASLGDSVITGKVSGWTKVTYGETTTETKYSGKEMTINKNSTEPTEAQEKIEYWQIVHMAYEYFDSYYLKNLKIKA